MPDDDTHRPAAAAAVLDPTADNPGGADAEGARPARARPAHPRNAATLILWRATATGHEVLMGRRHARMRFMPDVMVFPGGRVDLPDHRAPALSELRPLTRRMLELRATPSLARALAVAAARELFEETGLVLGQRDGEAAVAADLGRIDYLCRAVTPATRPIRFNARFLIAPAEAAEGHLAGSGELEALRFYRLDELHAQPVASITAMVLDEFRAWLAMSPQQRARWWCRACSPAR